MAFSFAEILKGGVNFVNNQPCNVETIQWFDIVNGDNKPKMVLPSDISPSHCSK